MSRLILAQGAEHMDQNKLIAVINKINSQKLPYRMPGQYNQYISDQYNIVTNNVYCTVDYVVEEKYDGYSYLNSDGKFFSKRLSAAKGNEGAPIDKTDHMPHLAKILKTVYELTGCDLHGELYVPGGISDDVTKILGCTADEAVRRTTANWNNRLRYMLIDIRAYKGKILINEPYYIRRAILEHLYYMYISPIDTNGDIHLAPILSGDPREEFKRIVLSGGEGIIIKRTDALYCPDKKPTNNWIKGKKKITHDVVITGFNDGTGKNKTLFGSIEFGHYIDGKLVKCGSASSGLNDATRQMIASDPSSYIGTVMEIEAIQESVKSFRNAVFLRLRDDKDAKDCTPINIRVKEDLV